MFAIPLDGFRFVSLLLPMEFIQFFASPFNFFATVIFIKLFHVVCFRLLLIAMNRAFVFFFFFYSFYGPQKASKQNGIVRTNCSKFTQTGVLDHPITQERWSRLKKKIIIQKQKRSNINTHAIIHKNTHSRIYFYGSMTKTKIYFNKVWENSNERCNPQKLYLSSSSSSSYK